MPDGQVAAVLEKIPCYREGIYVMSDFKRLISEKLYKEIYARLPILCSAIEEIAKINFSANPKLNFVAVVKYIEEQTKLDRGKGKKTQTVIEVKEDIPDDEVELNLRSMELDPPKLVIFKSEDIIKGQYIVADGTYVDCCSTSGNVAVIELLAVYYVLDLEYPKWYAQVLGILQTHLLRLQPYFGLKSVKYKKFSTELHQTMTALESCD